MLRVIKPDQRVEDLASGVMLREAAIAGATTGADRLWVGYVELPPGSSSAVHHHGIAESAIYVISGQARFISGETLSEVQDADPGDFVWVGPHEVHVELNRSDAEPVRMVVARSTQEGIVINIDPPRGWVPPV